MTIESNISKNTHIGNGVTIHFPFTYKIWKKEEMLVTIEDEKGITSNITPYDVILGDNGGEVVLYIDNENKTPIPKGYTIALTRNMPFLQEQDYINGGRFNAEVVEENFDIVTAELQQLLESSERTIKVPVTSSTEPEELLNELYNARNIAVEQAGVATQQAQISTEQATLSGSYAQTANEQAVLSQQYADISQRWAESETPPDPSDPNSKSAKTWAAIAADTVPLATNVLPGKVAPQYPLVTDDTGKLTYDGYNRGWGAKQLNNEAVNTSGETDLNTIIDNGFYHIDEGAGLHKPSNSPITLYVSGSESKKLQTAYCLYESEYTDNLVFVRSKFNETWSPWVSLSLELPGDFKTSFRSSIAGYLLCDGSEISRTTYKDLFDIIGTTFGEGDGTDTFNIPDLRDRFIQGANDNLGTVFSAGLPEIVGTLSNDMLSYQIKGSGAINVYSLGTDGAQGSSTYGRWGAWSIRASRSSPVYGKSTTVQPPAIALNVFIKY